jgi:hypothetical protein
MHSFTLLKLKIFPTMFCQSGDNTLKQYMGIYTARMKNTIMNQDLKKIEKEGWMQTYWTTLHAKHVVLIL